MKCETSGIKTDSIINNIDSNILVLNFINNIMSPITNTGVVINKQVYILDINIVFTFIGNDFKITILLPSKLINEFVIEVI